jgi:hypothetical protein
MIDDSINKAIKTREQEFLQAYKTHISEVQNDIDDMREEADEIKELKRLAEQEGKHGIIDLKQERHHLATGKIISKLEYYCTL